MGHIAIRSDQEKRLTRRAHIPEKLGSIPRVATWGRPTPSHHGAVAEAGIRTRKRMPKRRRGVFSSYVETPFLDR